MGDVFQWIFEGVGTMLLGLVLGAAGGGTGAWIVAKRRYQKQSQRAGRDSYQVQGGRDVNL